MTNKIYIKTAITIALLCILYFSGIPPQIIIIIGIMAIVLTLFKTRIYKRLEETINKKSSPLSKINPTTKKIIIIILFILLYLILKQIIFFSLKQFGIDIEQLILEGINQT